MFDVLMMMMVSSQWESPSGLADVSCTDVVAKDALGLVLKYHRGKVSNRVKHPHWADSKLGWNRTLVTSESSYINWSTIWSQNRNLEELNCANFSQSWCLRLEKHLQVYFLNGIRFLKNQLEYFLPRFWGSHTLSGQEASLGTWYWYFWMGDHSSGK